MTGQQRMRQIWWAAVGAAAALSIAGGVFLHLTAAPAPLQMPPPVVALVPGVSAVLSDAPTSDQPLPWVAEGRVEPAMPHGAWHEWPGAAFAARFEGDILHIALDDPENRFRVKIDGTPVADLTRTGAATVVLSGLGPGPHDLRLERLSESGVARQMVGLGVPAPGRALPPPALPRHRIDVYGDSDTVGLGLLRGDRRCSGDDVFLSTDTTQAYPAELARRFGATAAVMARSGIGLIRGHAGTPLDQNMRDLYRRVLPSAPEQAEMPPPWLIVVEVGANDFVQPLQPDEPWGSETAFSDAFSQAFAGFLDELMQDAPDTPVLVLAVPDPGKEVRPEIVQVAERLQARGAAVRLVPVQGLDYLGCNWHPSLADHQKMADALTTAVDDLVAVGLLEK